ncbi:MAG: penicillin-binding protein 2 [Alphaproteobacteria bacterium]|nr:penicillin-binding protein 2 [Alphaproteobacteria bacterium]
MTARDSQYDRRRGLRRFVQLEGVAKQALDTGHVRLIAVAAGFALCFLVIAGRLIGLTTFAPKDESANLPAEARQVHSARAEILDRHGILLAGNVRAVSLFANPRKVMDAARAASQLAAVLPGLEQENVLRTLSSDRGFVWIKRHLSPRQQDAVNRLGIPGLGFADEERRVYPLGRLAAHVVGFTGVDREGLTGIEKGLDDDLSAGRATTLSIDVRVQHAIRAELLASVEEFQAIGAAAIVMDVHSGEIVAMVSLPDFDPDAKDEVPADNLFNRATLGVYEMGSTFKTFNTAAALEFGLAGLTDTYDASKPLRVARFTINDDHAKNRWLTVAEIFQYSSNIGSARMALDVGPDRQRAFLKSLGLLDRPQIEIPEVSAPMVPNPWREISTMTVAYGHGIAVSPLQMATAYSIVVNGGLGVTPTLIARRSDEKTPPLRILSERTSQSMRELLSLVVEDGTGKQAKAEGYLVGGKTGTAEKAGAGGYRRNALLSSFVAAFPIDDPRYVVFVALDEPKGIKRTFNFASAGWTAAPAVSRVVSRIAPLLGVAPTHGPAATPAESLLVSVSKDR